MRRLYAHTPEFPREHVVRAFVAVAGERAAWSPEPAWHHESHQSVAEVAAPSSEMVSPVSPEPSRFGARNEGGAASGSGSKVRRGTGASEQGKVTFDEESVWQARSR